MPGRRHDRLTDNALSALRAWEAKEDEWLGQVKAIDPATIDQAPLRATHAIVGEALEASRAARVCRVELWKVSQITGWQIDDGYIVTIQPVGTDQARQEALARWGSLPKYIDTEIANLREGLRLGYTAPKGNVRIVIDQIRSLVSTPLAASPFGSPAVRDTSPEFRKQFEALVADQIATASKRYADFLEREYLPAARDAIAVSANPNGAACYEASIRSYSSASKSSRAVHELGLQQVIDSGIHSLGWTRQQAIDYLLAHTTESSDSAAAEVDRYIIWPGQATAYMIGMLEIRQARDEAEKALSAKFDLRALAMDWRVSPQPVPARCPSEHRGGKR